MKQLMCPEIGNRSSDKENSAKTSQVELILGSLFKRLEKKEEKGFSDYDFQTETLVLMQKAGETPQ